MMLRPNKRSDPVICDGLRSCATPKGPQSSRFCRIVRLPFGQRPSRSPASDLHLNSPAQAHVAGIDAMARSAPSVVIRPSIWAHISLIAYASIVSGLSLIISGYMIDVPQPACQMLRAPAILYYAFARCRRGCRKASLAWISTAKTPTNAGKAN
jgi:hypothetical protein